MATYAVSVPLWTRFLDIKGGKSAHRRKKKFSRHSVRDKHLAALSSWGQFILNSGVLFSRGVLT